MVLLQLAKRLLGPLIDLRDFSMCLVLDVLNQILHLTGLVLEAMVGRVFKLVPLLLKLFETCHHLRALFLVRRNLLLRLFELVGAVVAFELGLELELVLFVGDGVELGLKTAADLLGLSLCLA
jgi:hypothetical protein